MFREFDHSYRPSLQLFQFDYTFFEMWARCVFKLWVQNNVSLDLFSILILIAFNICYFFLTATEYLAAGET